VKRLADGGLARVAALAGLTAVARAAPQLFAVYVKDVVKGLVVKELLLAQNLVPQGIFFSGYGCVWFFGLPYTLFFLNAGIDPADVVDGDDTEWPETLNSTSLAQIQAVDVRVLCSSCCATFLNLHSTLQLLVAWLQGVAPEAADATDLARAVTPTLGLLREIVHHNGRLRSVHPAAHARLRAAAVCGLLSFFAVPALVPFLPLDFLQLTAYVCCGDVPKIFLSFFLCNTSLDFAFTVAFRCKTDVCKCANFSWRS
jgi:hypothetical protein